jgi:hypothetical protein
MVGPHRLSDAAFAALAAGRPDAATVAGLRRAQLSRHLLLLRGIVRAAPATTIDWYGELAAAERRAPGPVRDVLAYPLVGAWAAGCLAALRTAVPSRDANVGHLATIARTATRAAAVPGAPTTGAPTTGAPTSGAPIGDVGPPDLGSPAAHRLTAEHDGLRLDVLLDDVDPARARLGLTPTGRLAADAVARWEDRLRAAWRILVARHRGYAEVMAIVLTCLVPVEPDPTARGVSATSADAFGAVAVSEPPDPTALAVGLLHETQHSLLNAVQYLFDLQEPSDALVYSPWRDDPRPASGLLHGTYAYLGVTDFWRVESRNGDPVAAFEFARWRSAVVAATNRLRGLGGLSPAGDRFVGVLRERVCSWLDEPVPPEVLRLAEGANTDHHLRWRLRNLHVDPTAVGRLADAWRRGVPPPHTTVRAVVRAAPRRFEQHARLDLTHRLLRDGSLPGDRAADDRVVGDRAYLRGDASAAARAYRTAVVRHPGDDAAWAGLALTTDRAVAGADVLRLRPELVAAVHRALPDTAGDPRDLAAWLIGIA